MKKICLNKDSLQGRELSPEELIEIRGGKEINSHYSCTFRKHTDDEGTEYDYYAESAEVAATQCMEDHKSECDSEKPGCQCACG